MEKLNKIGAILMANKERAVLAVMVVIFGWRVYAVLNPEQSLPPATYRLPKADDGQIPPSAVPAPPPPRQATSLEAIYTPNPFWSLSSQKEVRGNDKEAIEDAQISLVRIQKGRGGRVRAQIKTAGSTQWFDEGASFESFQLLQINPDEGTCLVRSERLGKNITLSVTQR